VKSFDLDIDADSNSSSSYRSELDSVPLFAAVVLLFAYLFVFEAEDSLYPPEELI